MADVEMEDSDPIKASYDVFIKPHMSGTQQVFILQFPNRDSRQHYSARHQSQPLKMRVKPTAGMVELDVPMDVYRNYDKDKGVRWGGAMKKSKANHGLPGGFGIGGSVTAGRGRARNIPEEHAAQQQLLDDFDNCVREEHVLVKQTLGGQTIPTEENTPQYMIGTFEKGNLPRPFGIPFTNIYRSITSYSCRQHRPNATSIPPYRCTSRTRSICPKCRSCA
jgi:DNA-directed RNA polymerase-3 subunit RPC5